LKIVAPSVVFKSEAIVHPDEVDKYIGKEECELSYNPLLMALIWNSLATRKTKLLTQSMQQSFAISPDCAWVNYIRCHDDIGWTFDDAVADNLGINPHDHRYFLNQFFTGRFEGSFAKGVAFAENKETGDCRVCGSLASLAGLESALEQKSSELVDLAVARILMVHSIILSIGGIPLLYSGDELGLLNDYSYQTDKDKMADDRWVHRIEVTDKSIKRATQKGTPEFSISSGLKKLISIRKSQKLFGEGSTRILQSNNEHVFAYARETKEEEMLVMCNFSEHPQTVNLDAVGLDKRAQLEDLITQASPDLSGGSISLSAYQVLWLKR
jgi:amylosucrase